MITNANALPSTKADTANAWRTNVEIEMRTVKVIWNAFNEWQTVSNSYQHLIREINKLIGKVNREGFTLIPTKLYLKKGKAKIEIAVAKGKKQYDKRQAKKTRLGPAR